MARRFSNAKAKRDVRISTQARISQAQTKITPRPNIFIKKAPQEKRYKRIVVNPTTHPKQTVIQPSVKRGTLRITLRHTECRIRKEYKKKMLKSIAAQIKRSGRNMSSWRKKRAQNRRIIYRC